MSSKRAMSGHISLPFGEIPAGWKCVPLGEVFVERVETGFNHLPLLSVTGDRGVVPRDSLNRRDSSNEDKSAYLRVLPGDIVYNTMRMWQGVAGLSELEGLVSPAYTVCRPLIGRLLPAFAPHLLKHPSNIRMFYRHSQGLVDDTLNLKFHHFARIRIKLPSLKEQRRIATVLGDIDSALFGGYKAIEQRRHVRDSTVLAQIRALRCTQIELGGLITSFDAGKSPSCEDRQAAPSEAGVLRISAVTMDGFLEAENKVISDSTIFSPHMEVRCGDFLITRANTSELVGLTCVAGGPGTLSGCTGQKSSGVTTFTGCSINAAGSGYKLTATDGTLTSATSTAFSITVGAPSQLAFTTQPGNGANGGAFGTQPTVSVEDAGGNVVTTATNAVTLAIASQPGNGATLTCTTNPLAASAGVNAFAGCQIVGKAGTYTLSATSAGLTSATSASLTLSVGPATQVAFTTQPGGGANGATWNTQPVVSVEDSGGNVVTGATNSITLALGTQPVGGGTLACTTNPKAAAAGVATFSGCKITGKSGAYTLTATAAGLATATSNPLTISAGAATQLVFTTQPGGGANGAAFGTQPVVAIEDASGNVATTNTSNVTLSIASQPGTGATLNCGPNTQAAKNGVVAFTTCQISGTIGTYKLTATDGTLTSATSTAFSITVGAPSQLAFTTQPGNGANGAAFGTQPTVSVEDAGGNVVTTATNAVTLAIASQPGNGATLTCTTNPLAASAGVNAFAGCQIVGKAGTYTLSATSAGLTSATSASLTLSVGPATQVAFTTQPGGGANGATWNTQPVVSVEDSGGNVVTGATNSITLALGTQPVGGGTLACTTNPKAAAAGVATFSGCKITGKSGAYTLTATAAGLATATSNPLTISAGAATQLVFTTQPGSSTGGVALSTQPVVSIEDSGGNVVTGNTNSVNLAIASQPGTGATLTCTTNPKGATAGVATFAGCQSSARPGTTP